MLFQKASEYCKRSGIYSLLEDADTVIVGFSGGADSRVLLSFFTFLREIFPSLKIIAAHVNHMIRGDEADRDEEFCKEVCREAGIPIEIAKIDVPALSLKSGKGLEETAREARYAFFADLSKKYQNSIVATAHNADDNLETVILNLARGSGTKGMSGIAPVRDRLVRPLLSCTSEEIRSFAKENGLEFVCDSTNGDTAYSRNAVRHTIAPLLSELNPKVADAALRLSVACREDCDFLESEARRFLSSKPLTREGLDGLHPALFSRVITVLYRNARSSGDDLSAKNIADCKKALSGTEMKSVSLPHGLAFFADSGEVYIARDPRCINDEENEPPEPVAITNDVPAYFCDFCIICTESENYIDGIDENVYNLSLHEAIDCGRINGSLVARQRRPGDILRRGKMSRKLKKLLCDKGVPVHLRDRLPVIEDGDGILYVPFVGLRDGAAPSDGTEKIINLHIMKRK